MQIAHLKQPITIGIILLTIAGIVAAKESKKRPKRPNILFIMSDDHTTQAIGANMSPDGNRILVRSYLVKNGKRSRGYAFYDKTKSGWRNPVHLGIKNYEKYDKDKYYNAYYCQDGKTLIFSLDSIDDQNYINHLYVSFLQNDNTWSEPKRCAARPSESARRPRASSRTVPR